MNKRQFLKMATALGTPAILPNWLEAQSIAPMEQVSPDAWAEDEAFWKGIRDGYLLKKDYINLENGYYNIIPQATLERYVAHIREINLQGAYYMRTVQFANKQKMAGKLADIVGCNVEELIITRNTTESLDMIIGGLDWKAGDEAVMAVQDYGAMLDMFQQVSERFGVVNKKISIPNHPQSDEAIVQLYENAIGPKTRLLMVCHMINITGHILPIRKICDMAHSKGVLVMVDGAHALAQIQYKVSALNCDFYGASLHKWLSVPLGAGFLYVKKEHIPKIWPLMADSPRPKDDIARLNHIGTHPPAVDLTISDAIDYYQLLQPARKEARLRYLQQYWTSKVRHLPHVILNTPEAQQRSCAIANVGIKGMTPAKLAEVLLQKFGIYTVAIDVANVQGCRITPNVYTTIEELDALVNALQSLA